MGASDAKCLKAYSVTLGSVLILVSIGGIGFSLFLLFGEPFANQTNQTYRPDFENIGGLDATQRGPSNGIIVGPLMVCSVVSLLANIALIGGAKQLSEKIVLTWIVWKYLLILLWWAWYGYNMLKYHGYIDWTAQGMRQCYWCHQRDVQEMMGYIGAIASFVLLVLMIPVHMLHKKTKSRYRYATESEYELEQPQYQQQYPYHPQQSHYNQYQPQQQHYPYQQHYKY